MVEWLFRTYSGRWARTLLHYLDAHVDVIRGPEDVRRILDGKPGDRNLNLAVRALLRWLREECLAEELAEWLRRGLRPIPKVGVDLRRPREEDIIGLLRAVRGERYEALVHLLLDSGARISDALRALDGLDRAVEVRPGIFKIPVGRLMGPKRCFWCYCTGETLEAVKRMPRPSYNAIIMWHKKRRFMPLKLVRKFAYTQMRRCGIYPEVARFLQGRVQGISEECYEDLELLADEQYPRYAAYVRGLRACVLGYA